MWIFLSDSFVSIVEHRDDPSKLLVRSRNPNDLRRLFDEEIVHTPYADYQYRVVTDRDTVARVMCDAVRSIDYGNFKNTVHEKTRHWAYFDVWFAMNRAYSETPAWLNESKQNTEETRL